MSVWQLLQGLGGVATLLALFAFFFKEKIKQRLAFSIASRIEKEKADLARDHAKYLLELEQAAQTYRLSLLAETERLKAHQHLKTTVALKLSERKYAAICEVHGAYASLPPQIYSIACTKFDYKEASSEFFDSLHEQARAGVDDAIKVLKLNRAFILPELFKSGSNLTTAMINILALRDDFSSAVIDKVDPRLIDLARKFSEFEGEISKSLKEFELPSL